ncbi:unnamed protein product [Phytophthora lilii]|uniref:Unnamed protein product n=1 Tax=Phytophthora lilii TaxID=2077276 RepID=A0A9W7CQX5_9STRA|nr:unnamed protein product [Phytophthora lilii]
MNTSDLLNSPSHGTAECLDQGDRQRLRGSSTTRSRPSNGVAAITPKPKRAKLDHAQGSTIAAACVHDNERKRPYRLSTTRKMRRRAHEEYESHVFNLALDVNELRQQVGYLLECRDLWLTRLFVYRQEFEGTVLVVVTQFLNEFSNGGASVTANELNCYFPRGASNLVLGRGTHVFSHRSWSNTSTKVLSFVEEEEDGGPAEAAEAAETRRLCGGSNGCVVEALGIFAGRTKREMLATFYPHVLSDEALVSRLIGFNVTRPIRFAVYFDDRRRITHQVTSHRHRIGDGSQASPSDFAGLMGSRVSKLDEAAPLASKTR